MGFTVELILVVMILFSKCVHVPVMLT